MTERNISRRDFADLGRKAVLGAASLGIPKLDHFLPRENEYAPGAIPITTLGLRGTLYGGGGLGFTDTGEYTTTADELVQVAISRHLRMEQSFGHPLNAHLNILTFYPHNSENNISSQHTGDIIRAAVPAYSRLGRDLSFSIEIQPPAWYSLADTAALVEQIMTGQFNNLPRDMLVENIHKLSISYDFELMVWGDTLSNPNSEHNYVSIQEFNEVLNRPYLQLHKLLQQEHVQTYGASSVLYNAPSSVYNFGTNASDDLFLNDTEFDPEVQIDLDSIGSSSQKAVSADSFYKLYGREVNMMFFLLGSPHLDHNESDYGFSPWDYDAIVRWSKAYSRGRKAMNQ